MALDRAVILLPIISLHMCVQPLTNHLLPIIGRHAVQDLERPEKFLEEEQLRHEQELLPPKKAH